MEIARSASNGNGARQAFPDKPGVAGPQRPLSHPLHKLSDMEIARNASDGSGARLAFPVKPDRGRAVANPHRAPAVAGPTDPAAARGALSHPPPTVTTMDPVLAATPAADTAATPIGPARPAAGGSSRGVVSRVWAAVAALFTSPVDLLALTDVGLEKHLGLLARGKSRLAALEAAAVAELARRRGDKAAADVVAAIVREPRGGARRAVKHAKQLAKVAKTADALADGAISPQQAKKIAEAADDTPIDEDFLIDAARRGEPDAFNGAVRRHVNERNRGETLAVRRRRQHNRRYAHIREETDGMFTLHAEFDPIAGRQVAAEISTRSDHLWRHEDAGDRATPEQRRADALADLITNSTAGRRGTPSVGIMIHADVDLTAQALANTLTNTETANSTASETAAGADAVRPNGANADGPSDPTLAGVTADEATPGTDNSDVGGGAASGSPPGGAGFAWRLVNPRLDDGTPLADEEFLAWACDALLLPAVFRAKTQPLWLGRGKRYPTKALRDTLEARDGGCAGCDKSVYWCQAHHIVHWVHGGPTDIDNLVLLCNYCHHHKVHTLGYTVTVRPDGKYALQPPTSTRHPDNDTHPDNNGTGDLTAGTLPDNASTGDPTGGTRSDDNSTRDPAAGAVSPGDGSSRNPTDSDTRSDDRGTRDPAVGALFETVGIQQTDPTDRNSGSVGRSHTVACRSDHMLTIRIPQAGPAAARPALLPSANVETHRASDTRSGSHTIACRAGHFVTRRTASARAASRGHPTADGAPRPAPGRNADCDSGASDASRSVACNFDSPLTVRLPRAGPRDPRQARRR